MEVCVLLCLIFVFTASGFQKPKTRNYYDALNVETTSTQSKIKRAFRSLALKYHPDKNKSAEAEESFREIAEAYKVLSSSKDRKLYDRLGHEAFVKNEAGASPKEEGPNFDDIFHFFEEDMFEMDKDFMWTFPDDSDSHFHSPEFTYVFPNGHENDFDEDYFF